MTRILVLNAGSSSIKFAVFDGELSQILSGAAIEIGGAGQFLVGAETRPADLPDHEAALREILKDLAAQGLGPDRLTAVGHRVVHGGRLYTAPTRVSPEVEAGIEACVALAPLHNPNALLAIRALRRIAPDLVQCASFDTAFHATNAPVAQRYAIPKALHDEGLQRYGFHGLSYASIVETLGADLPERLLAFHLGGGASLCAIRNGKSVATTMGYSPLDGLTMATRSGAIDASLALRLAREEGTDRAEEILNAESGLLALAGETDMAALLARSDPEARFAVEHFCYWAARHAGSAVVAMGGVDAFAFTGGIGANADAVRAGILDRLAFLGPKPVHVVPAQEERQIARDVLSVLNAG